MTRQEQIIYAAGFFDGEGCISISTKTSRTGVTYYGLDISAMQRMRGPLDIMRDLFGGAIHVHSKRHGGWVWRAGGATCVRALEEMLPYLVVKRSQADLALVFQARKVSRGGKYREPLLARNRDQGDWREMRLLKVV